MSDPATWLGSAGFHKRYRSAGAASAALQRSAAARAAGVLSPAARATGDPAVLVFDRIEAPGAPSVAEMLDAVEPLRRMPPTGLSRIDPFARIQPRLAKAPLSLRRLAAAQQRRDQSLDWRADGVVHGDFHPGQVLRDRQGRVWMIDLDDLALGPAEADLGNLAAWLATQAEGPLPELAQAALDRVLAEAPAADAALTTHFRDIALLRRALKLRERGVGWVTRQIGSGPGYAVFLDPVAQRVTADAKKNSRAGDVSTGR